MIDRHLTKGSAFPITSLDTLNLKRKDFEDKFPPKYYPEISSGVNPMIRTRARDISPGVNNKIAFVVATKAGIILNSNQTDYCQLPKEGYLGRYIINPGETDAYGNHKNPSYTCSYWVDYNNIELRESGIGTDNPSSLVFVPILLENLPEELRAAITSKCFFDIYFG